jgi:sortase A
LGGERLKKSSWVALSTVLILAGCVFMAVPLLIEGFEYPWVPASDESELPDPSPPAFAAYSYAEYVEIVKNIGGEEGGERAKEAAWRDILPGGEEEEVDEPSPETSPESAQNKGGHRYVLLGSVKIPKINLSENLFMGAEDPLRHGVGHLEGSPMPGEEGNAVLAAHRVSSNGKQPFRHLDKLVAGDAVSVKFGEEIFIYEVFDSFIVSQHDLWVLQPVKGEPYLLTLVTCDPVVSAGRRENRLIVRARLII